MCSLDVRAADASAARLSMTDASTTAGSISSKRRDRYAGTPIFVSDTAPPLVTADLTPDGSDDQAGLLLAADAGGAQAAALRVAMQRSDAGSSSRKALRAALARTVEGCIQQDKAFVGRYVLLPEGAKEGGQAVVHFARRCATLHSCSVRSRCSAACPAVGLRPGVAAI